MRLTVTNTETFENIVTKHEYFSLVIHFIDVIMIIAHAKFQAKILNVVGDRAL